MPQSHGEHVVTVGVHVRGHGDGLTHRTFDRKSAGVDFGKDAFDRDSPAAIVGRRGLGRAATARRGLGGIRRVRRTTNGHVAGLLALS
jgi:hypothetical protein